MNQATALAVLKLVDLALLGVEIAADVKRRYDAQRGKLEVIVREGRDPTPEELAEFDAAIESLRNELHA